MINNCWPKEDHKLEKYNKVRPTKKKLKKKKMKPCKGIWQHTRKESNFKIKGKKEKEVKKREER
jgi:hypothetical protein